MPRACKVTLRPWLVFWCVLVLAAPAQANPPKPNVICDPVQTTLCATALDKGEAAPFDGQLLTTTLALKLGQEAAACDVRVQAEITRCTQDAAVTAKQVQDQQQADAQDFAAKLAQLQTELQRAQKVAEDAAPPWYMHPGFVAPVVAVVTAGVVVWALHH